MNKPLEYYMKDNAYLAYPQEGDEETVHCLMQTAKRYNIDLAEATPEERDFVFARAAENYKKPVAV